MQLISRPATLVLLTLAVLAYCVPDVAFAQSTISGRVTDTTGGVLPGVTVEAQSPALIEGARTAVTDGQGRYSIVELRPGDYVVTFTLPGFNTVQREGIEVVSDVNVPVNAELQVGALQETITVSGATPVVDVQQAGQRQVIPKEMLEALPTARATNTVGSVISGMKLTKPDFGGTTSFLQAYITSRGKDGRENTVDMEGMDVRMIRGCQAQGYTNFAMAEEVSVETNAPTAEVSGGGIRINMIPREGGNNYAGDVYFGGMTEAFQANNITDELVAAGLPTPTATKNILEINPAFGGPILRDKLWFMGSIRHLGVKLAPAGAINSDGSQGFNQTYTESLTGRLTWQATDRNKLTGYRDHSFRNQSHVDFSVNAGDEWDRVTNVWDWGRGSFIGAVKWTSAVSNRLLVENGYSRNGYNVPIYGWQPGVLRTEGTAEWFANASRFDQATGRTTVAPTNDCCHIYKQPSHVWTSAVSYMTGSHSFKTGLQYRWGETDVTRQQGNGGLQQLYINGIPDAVSVTANPSRVRNQVRHDVGLYVQDSWTIDRLTLNAGVRWEYFEWGVGEAASPAGRFIDARFTPAATPIPAFNDIAPRFSATYDLFGDAKTALKFSAGKYMGTLGATTFAAFNPIDVSSNTRNWFDVDLVPGTSTPSGQILASVSPQDSWTVN